MKNILGILKAFGIILAISIPVGGWIWSAAINRTHNQVQGKEIQTDLNQLIRSDSIKTIKIDSIILKVEKLNHNVNELSQGQSALRQSWVNYLYTHKDEDPLTEKVFVEYMQNLGFDLKKKLTNKDDMIASDK